MMASDPIRVCHIVSGDTWAGLESSVCNLIRAQAVQKDLMLTLVVLNEGRLAEVAREAGIPVRVVPETQRNVLSLIGALNKTLSEVAPTIIHTHRYKEQFLSYILARGRRARCVATIHGHEPPAALLDRLKVAVHDAVIFSLARAVGARFVAVSEDLRQRYGLPPERCTIIPNGIRVQDFLPCLEEHRRSRQSPLPVIGWIGRMVPIKGLGVLLEAVAQMSKRSLQVRVLLVGDGPDRAALEAQAQRLGIRDAVTFVGFATEPRRFLAEMDLFAFPSVHEGIPMVLLEAFAAGVPVVAAAVGGIPSMVGESRAARLITSSSPNAWAAALTEIIADRVQLEEMASKGRILVQERFSIEAMVQRYMELYAAAVS